MDKNAEKPKADEDKSRRRFGIYVDGLYKALINLAAVPGLVVDAANHAPRVLNLLPGVSGLKQFSDKPFLGSTFIRENLTSAYEHYNNLVGVKVPEPQDMGDHLAGMAGHATTVVLTAGAGVAAAATPAGAAVVSGAAGALTTVQAVPGIQAAGTVVTKVGKLSGKAAWEAVKHPMQTAGLAGTAAGTGVLADATLNEGKGTTRALSWMANKAYQKITGSDKPIEEDIKNALPPWLKDPAESAFNFLTEHSWLAKMGTAVLGFFMMQKLGDMLFGKSMMGSTIGLLFATGITLALTQGVGRALAPGAESSQHAKAAAPAPTPS